jgi:RNA polymerase sigma-70 factor (ECF subfamily)
MNEALLIQHAQAGSTQAFGQLVLAYQRFVYHLALQALGEPEDAQDAAQEAFLRAWLALPQFRAECRFSTWLYRIVMNLCINRRPRLKRYLAALSLENSEDSGMELPEEKATPPQLVEKMEEQAFLHQQVAQLPESQRLLISLRYQQDLSYEEIAEVLNLPLGTVKTGLYRAKAQLKAALLTRDKLPQEIAEWVN